MEKEIPEAVRLALAGNREAFSRLVKNYAGPLTALAYDRLGTVADAQDAVQEAFSTAYRRLGTLRDANAFGAWIYEILRTECAKRLRARGVDRRALEIVADRRAGEQALTPLEQAVAGERSEKLRKAVESLNPALREIVVLRYLGGAGRQEAAGMLGLSLAAADKRLERALRELREKLGD